MFGYNQVQYGTAWLGIVQHCMVQAWYDKEWYVWCKYGTVWYIGTVWYDMV